MNILTSSGESCFGGICFVLHALGYAVATVESRSLVRVHHAIRVCSASYSRRKRRKHHVPRNIVDVEKGKHDGTEVGADFFILGILSEGQNA